MRSCTALYASEPGIFGSNDAKFSIRRRRPTIIIKRLGLYRSRVNEIMYIDMDGNMKYIHRLGVDALIDARISVDPVASPLV
ncbi:MAG: hypothetical protein WC623_22195 [Pedobacter sp.]|uniref:hypothetical protein n=1 Tax=Pedobacter sp. TaxID=1411316 RepID=UPI0035615C24